MGGNRGRAVPSILQRPLISLDDHNGAAQDRFQPNVHSHAKPLFALRGATVTYAPGPRTPVSPMSKRGGVLPTTALNVTGATRDDYEGKELQSLTL